AAAAAAVAPPPAKPRPVRRERSDTAIRRVSFELRKGASRQLSPGISFGLTATDPYSHEISGWMWVMPDRRTIWLKAQGTHNPVVFYSRADGRRRELRITHVAANSAAGYLV